MLFLSRKIFIFIIYFINLIDSFNIINNYNVYLNLEKFNKKLNLLHIGITFTNSKDTLRYDFRYIHDNKKINDNNYLTPNRYLRTTNDIFNIDNIDNIDNTKNKQSIKEKIIYDVDKLIKKDIYWGVTNKTLEEIIDFEQKLHKKYRVGIYDCRHYVNEFTIWCLDKPSPIWSLHKLWDEN